MRYSDRAIRPEHNHSTATTKCSHRRERRLRGLLNALFRVTDARANIMRGSHTNKELTLAGCRYCADTILCIGPRSDQRGVAHAADPLCVGSSSRGGRRQMTTCVQGNGADCPVWRLSSRRRHPGALRSQCLLELDSAPWIVKVAVRYGLYSLLRRKGLRAGPDDQYMRRSLHDQAREIHWVGKMA